MKKTLFTILTLILSALFLITACDSPQGIAQEETTDPTETTAGNDITQAENADTEPINATTTTAEPYETVDPDLLYEIRNSPFADEAWLKQEFPNIIDAEITYRAPEQKFESLFSSSNDDYKTLDELIKIVGKPHGYTNRTGVVLFVWITAEGNPIPGYVYTMTSDLPEDVSFEERHLHYSKIYIQKPQSAPETTADPYVETTTLAP